jgi:riboflavin kinase/FMN adenylyltransferase
MRVFRRVGALPAEARGASVAIGNFDGVHRGHRAVLDAARLAALRLSAPFGAPTDLVPPEG